MLRTILEVATVLCLLVNFAPCAQAQTRALTLKAHPLSQTKSFLLTEFGMNHAADHIGGAESSETESGAMLAWELGWMRNISKRWALGATLFYNGTNDHAQFGFKPRARYWLGEELSLDMALGPVLRNFEDKYRSAIGLDSHIGFNFNSWLAVTIGLEYSHLTGIQSGYARPDQQNLAGDRTTISAGFRLGALPGTIVGTVGPLVVYWLFYLFFKNFEVDVV